MQASSAVHNPNTATLRTGLTDIRRTLGCSAMRRIMRRRYRTG